MRFYLNHSISILFCMCVPVLLIAQEDTTQSGSALDPAKVEFFEKKIRPVLIEHCYECHASDSTEDNGGLILDSREALLAGGEMGDAVVAGKPEKSLLLNALRYDDLEMPPSGRLAADIVADFEKWISDGAIDPREKMSDVHPVEKEQEIDWEEARKFWAFQVPKSRRLPAVKQKSWPNNRVDYFVLSRLEDNGIEPAQSADDLTLRKRLSMDLVGLPLDWNADSNQSKDLDLFIEELLAAPQFGEKWTRLWLDIARYAEDQAHIVGNNKALFYPNAYLYRNWVVNALNNDLPYDEFVKQQLAVDLIPDQDFSNSKQDEKSNYDELAALGFIGLGPKYYRRNSPQVMADEWEDRIDTVSRGLLGLTVACARCHDHKYDPVSTEDYYALAGVFASTEMYNMPMKQETNPATKQDDKNDEKNAKADKDKKKKDNTPQETLHIVRDKKKAEDLPVYVRGDVDSKGDIVPRRFLTVLSSDGSAQKFAQGSGRLELAESIAAPQNPLFARVFVNRVWAQLMGQGIVKTQSNFGQLGSRPSHPELLDDLSARFMENGWSLKWLVREIVQSETYQQSSVASDKTLQHDADNTLYSRMNRKRLTVEQWRDSILFCSSSLESSIGGKSQDPAAAENSRRTLYSEVSRFQLNSMLALFDFPDPNAHAASRNETTTPLQKLFALNSNFLLANAERLMQSLDNESTESLDAETWINNAYLRLFARAPSKSELQLAGEFLKSYSGDSELNKKTYLQTLLISNEFYYID